MPSRALPSPCVITMHFGLLRSLLGNDPFPRQSGGRAVTEEARLKTPVEEQGTRPSPPELMASCPLAAAAHARWSVDGVRLRAHPPAWPSPSGSKRTTAPRTIGASCAGPHSWASSPSCRSASAPPCRVRPSSSRLAGTWFFGDPSQSNPGETFLLLPGVVAVYGGMILFIRVWFGLVQTLRHRPGAPIRALAGMLALWIVPLLVRGPALQPGRLLLRRPGRNDEPPHQPVQLRAGHHRLGSVRDRGRTRCG